MELDATPEQDALVGAIRTLLARHGDGPAVRRAIASPGGHDPELWRILCEEIGAAALAIPEEYGGVGVTVFETHLVLEELGYSLAPSPYLGAVALAAQSILVAGDEDAARRLLPAVADGSSLPALAWADPMGRWDPERVGVTAVRGDPWRLTGETPLVLDGVGADVVVAIARTPAGPVLFELLDPAEAVRIATPAVDPALRIATLRFDRAAARPLGDRDALDAIRDRALAAITAVQVGVAARGLDMTVEYAKQRVQFGRPIGSFQALKHRMADMHVELQTARTASRAAARAIASTAADASYLAALAKARCSDALSAIAAEVVQLHGGIAITWEHDAQLVFKRAHATAQLFGTAEEQRRRVEQSLGLVAR